MGYAKRYRLAQFPVNLPPLWYDPILKWHPVRQRLWNATERYVVVPAGRRSGKTAIAKRKLVEKAISFSSFHNGLFMAGAPTRDQAKKIYWDDLKELSPRNFITDISETELQITYHNGARLRVVGFDKPQRAEGESIDGAVLDEFADMKPDVFKRSIRPAQSAIGRPGWCWFIGKAKGRNHFYDLYMDSLSRPGWLGLTWKSSEILDPAEIEESKRDMDERSFKAEYEAEFIDFAGRIYYPFTFDTHCDQGLEYIPELPLVFAFDFNVEPGVTAIGQEQRYRGKMPNVDKDKDITAWIGEVNIPHDSNTRKVCRKLKQDWGKHKGDVLCYGDATGGARGSAKVDGSDWDIIKQELRPVFGERLKFRVPDDNPAEKSRVNAVNTRFRTADELIHMLVNPVKAPYLVKDFEGVISVEGGSGEIDKEATPSLTHISDGVGYYVFRKHPTGGNRESVSSF